jgi:hypothetical protein
MKLQMLGTVGRATVPAETGRHGGRPYDSTRPKFLFRFDWTLAASGGARMKLHKIQDQLGISKWLVGVASGHDYLGDRG